MFVIAGMAVFRCEGIEAVEGLGHSGASPRVSQQSQFRTLARTARMTKVTIISSQIHELYKGGEPSKRLLSNRMWFPSADATVFTDVAGVGESAGW